MRKGSTYVFVVIVTIIIAILVAAIFIYSQGNTKKISESYANITNKTSIGDLNVKKVLGMFKKDYGSPNFYCANSIPGMITKEFCGCFGDDCAKDYFSLDDSNCDSAYGDYSFWGSENSYVAVCLKGDGCCDMPEPQSGSKVGQCLIVDFTKFNGKSIPLDALAFRVDADSHNHCNNDLYVYAKFEGDPSWKVVAKKLDGSGRSGLDGIYLDGSYFPKNVSKVAICPNPDKTGCGNLWGKYCCNHKIDWIKFKTSAPRRDICGGGMSPEVLLGEWSGNVGSKTKHYKVSETFSCNVPGTSEGGCVVTKIQRTQRVKDWGGKLFGSGDAGDHNKGYFSLRVGNYMYDKACVDGGSSGNWRTYSNEATELSLVYPNSNEISIESDYWELTGSAGGCTSKGLLGGCYKKSKTKECCPNSYTGKYMCASREYTFGDWSLKVYGKYCCPSGMHWDTTKNECVSD
ncbi:MAG: hypothetical protein J7L45_00995 [Candidatus Aenigmarchaeota archaeon]|nr:hypothetical protein [Candidatus Aenigmarchaeota archaeon]